MVNLNDIKENEECIIKSINLAGGIKRRMLDIGLIPGIKVKCLFISPFGDPKAYSIINTVVAIRKSEAEKIIVEKIGECCG